MNETETAAAYGGSFYAATKVDAPPRPQLQLDLDVDVCVIGGGLAGLTVTREIARSGRVVALIEAGRLAASASGRNTGLVLPGFAASPDSVVERVGFAGAKDLWTLSQRGVDYVRTAIRDEAMEGVAPQDGWLYVSKTDNEGETARLAALLGELGGGFGGGIERWPTERVRGVLRSRRYFNGLFFPQALSIHPLNYALGLAAAAERAGARIFENTPALSIDPAGVLKRIETPAARVRARHVVLCGNWQLQSLIPQIASALIPITTYVVCTAPLGPRLADAIGFSGAVSDSELADNHYRVADGDRLLWSGRATVWQGNLRRYQRALTRDITRTYPELGEVAIDYVWSGTLGNSIHSMPQIGELGPGLWLASGFGGHGLNTTAMAGNLIAAAIVEGDQTWRQFMPFELVWAGGMFGRATAQMYYWMTRVRDAVAERRSRAAERRRLRKAGATAGRLADAARSGDDGPVPAPPAAPESALPQTEPTLAPSRPRRRKRHYDTNA